MPKRITVTIEVPDDFESFDDLEQFVQLTGQQMKRKLCGQLGSDMAQRAPTGCCPKCESPNMVGHGSTTRTMKTIFGDVELPHPRQRCKVSTAVEEWVFLTSREFNRPGPAEASRTRLWRGWRGMGRDHQCRFHEK